MADQTQVPEEIQEEYYESEPRERAGVAWLLAFGTLIATIVVAAGIFFGGRWAYRQVVNNDEEPDPRPTSQNEPQREEEREPAVEDQQGEQPTPQPSTPTPQNNNQPQPDNGKVAGDTTGDLPGTGPGHTVAAFVIVSVFGYIGHQVFLATRTER